MKPKTSQNTEIGAGKEGEDPLEEWRSLLQWKSEMALQANMLDPQDHRFSTLKWEVWMMWAIRMFGNLAIIPSEDQVILSYIPITCIYIYTTLIG